MPIIGCSNDHYWSFQLTDRNGMEIIAWTFESM